VDLRSIDVTWFRLAVRGIGILLVAWGIPSLGNSLGYALFDAGALTPSELWRFVAAGALGPIAQIGIGLYLLVGARGLITYCCRGALGMCPACNYDVRHVPGRTCPECGVALPARGAADGLDVQPPGA
jgi:hypothetical protein